MPTSPEPWQLFWAKTDRASEGKPWHDPDWTHPLWAHLLDVANAALLLWEHYLPASLRRHLADSLGLPEPEAARLLALLIGLHDAGKAIPGFQVQHNPSWKALNGIGLGDPDPTNKRVHHGFATVALMGRWLGSRDALCGLRADVLTQFATFVGFHHGRLSPCHTMRDLARELGSDGWQHAQGDLIDHVVALWPAALDPGTTPTSRAWSDWLLPFAGWATLADWVGSMSAFFPPNAAAFAPPDGDPAAYLPESKASAEAALRATKLEEQAALVRHDPAHLFDFDGLRPLQEVVYGLGRNETAPSLTIVEAPTGEGKTEAAFLLAARQQAHADGRGLYVAMPTMATSNGLFPRFRQFLERAHDPLRHPAGLVLLHGTADLNPDYQELLDDETEPGDVYDREEHAGEAEGPAAVRVQTWFRTTKRGLLAPYGIGTVDQVLLGVLFSKHFFLRLLGLYGKTVIFDEVHAYDTYMSALFERLLRWLRALGASVIILSATLPATTRRRLLDAWGVPDAPPEANYPAVWHAGGDGLRVEDGFETAQRQTVHVEWRASDREDVAAVLDEVRRAVDAGAAVAVIVNTVDRAQQLFDALTTGADALPLAPEDCHLLHARFLLEDRARREQAVLGRFGKQAPSPGAPPVPRRPGPALLVATQVAEQSLDLDFDFMLTDLAPVDLLLQRAGRLHRHALPYERPAPYDTARLLVLCPAPNAETGLPDVDAVGYVYDTLTLLRTWHLLQQSGRQTWVLPDHYRALIEGVYVEDMDLAPVPDGLPPAGAACWGQAQAANHQAALHARSKADNRLIPPPGRVYSLLTRDHPELADEDDPRIHEDMKALTRLGEPSINVVCLHADRTGALFLDADCRHPARLDELADEHTQRERRTEIVRALLKRSVRIAKKELVEALAQKVDADWKRVTDRTPALFYHRRLVFHGNACTEIPRFRLRIDDRLGLVIERVPA